MVGIYYIESHDQDNIDSTTKQPLIFICRYYQSYELQLSRYEFFISAKSSIGISLQYPLQCMLWRETF